MLDPAHSPAPRRLGELGPWNMAGGLIDGDLLSLFLKDFSVDNGSYDSGHGEED